MKRINLSWMGLLAVLLISGGVIVGCQKDAKAPELTSNAKGGNAPKTYLKPSLTCMGEMNTQSTIYLKFTAGGGEGAPAGFSIQWMLMSDYVANGSQWPASDDPKLCKASFSGKANGANYNLAAGKDITIAIGELLPEYAYFSGGAVKSADPACVEFDCGQSYIFRAFAHGDNKMGRSEFSDNETCSTEDCPPAGSDCAKKKWYGWWKKESNFSIVGNPTDETPGFMQVGAVAYSAKEVYDILNINPSINNGLLILAHHLISSKLNILNGAEPKPENILAIAAADTEIGSKNLFTTTMTKSDLDAKMGPLHKFNSSCK